jgi:glutamine amidotransferase
MQTGFDIIPDIDMTAIVDYKAGNLTSVRLAFDALGEKTVVTSDPDVVRSADRVVFPGVGAARSAMENLARLGLDGAVRDAAVSGRPFLGICLGMQILFDHTEEDGGTDLLGIIPGRVRRFPAVPGFKVPEIGWNQVSPSGACFYFVHSYYAETGPYTVGRTEYAGVEFSSAVRKGGIFACQFHPEKSGRAGLALLKGWLEC